MPDLVSRQEWVDWCSLRPTKQLVEGFFNTREDLKEDLVEMKYITEQEKYIAIGRAQALKDMIDYITRDFEYLERYENNDVESSESSDNS